VSTLSPLEKKALRGLVGTDHRETYQGFAVIGHDGELPRHHVRRAVRGLARKGFAKYARGLWSDDGRPAGSGYALTDAGLAFVDAIEAVGELAFWAKNCVERKHHASVGRNAERQDAQRLGPKDEHAVPAEERADAPSITTVSTKKGA
jgi:hypothetical protein